MLCCLSHIERFINDILNALAQAQQNNDKPVCLTVATQDTMYFGQTRDAIPERASNAASVMSARASRLPSRRPPSPSLQSNFLRALQYRMCRRAVRARTVIRKVAPREWTLRLNLRGSDAASVGCSTAIDKIADVSSVSAFLNVDIHGIGSERVRQSSTTTTAPAAKQSTTATANDRRAE
jgi:hypothetical protein